MFYENIIIGAGPAGLQAAYFFKKYNINYLVIEKNELCGSFFNQYPHSGKLISINKIYTGNENKDFNLRHDWNSLLNDEDLLMKEYSEEYYPDREDLVKYLNDFYSTNNLNVQFNSEVETIDKLSNIAPNSTASTDNNTDKYVITLKNSKKFMCNKLIIATGLSKPHRIELDLDVKDPIKHYADYPQNYFRNKENLNEFKNKFVLIIGGGNASFELGLILNNYTSKILITGQNYRDWALSTHYSGDIRSIYLPFQDTFLLKSLNAVDINNFDLFHIKQEEPNGQYSFIDKIRNDSTYDYYKFDKIILCTGWKFDTSIFNFDLELTPNKKYPAIEVNYESSNNTNLFFIGALMHSDDFRKSSGGFIHGFRYLIKHFMNFNYDIPFEKKEFNIITFEDLISFTKFIIYRINTSSDLYQMFKVLTDIFYFNIENKSILYYQSIKYNLELQKTYDLKFILSLEFGAFVSDINKIGKKVTNIGTESNSTLIHPVLRIYTSLNKCVDVIHFDEDLFAEFHDSSRYFYKLLRTLKPYFM